MWLIASHTVFPQGRKITHDGRLVGDLGGAGAVEVVEYENGESLSGEQGRGFGHAFHAASGAVEG
jgi:hypothetical protein